MPLFETLAIGTGAILLAFLLRLLTKNPSRIFGDLRVWHASLLLGIGASVLSLMIKVEAFAGTGTRISKGWPKPYQFDWTSFDKTEANSGFNALYFIGNSVFYFGLAFLLTTLLVTILGAVRQEKRA